MKEIPQHAIDTLPGGYVMLGFGGDFKVLEPYFIARGYWDTEWSSIWEVCGNNEDGVYCAPIDSPIAKLNAIKAPSDTPQALPTDAAERKTFPLYSGLVAYFPHALSAVANLSYQGNLQHHPDKPLHWDMDKSSDELDALMRHIVDEDWVHVAWRALANLERKMTGKCQYEKETK
jgi:hypothetical protein